MISFELKNYIEKNVNLLDTDLTMFMKKALNKLSPPGFEHLIMLMKSAQIDIEGIVSEMLINRLSFLFSVVEDGRSLLDFITEDLIDPRCRTNFGLSVKQLFDFIETNQDIWKLDMFLDVDSNNITRIRTGN